MKITNCKNNHPIEAGQKFCHDCGVSIMGKSIKEKMNTRFYISMIYLVGWFYWLLDPNFSHDLVPLLIMTVCALPGLFAILGLITSFLFGNKPQNQTFDLQIILENEKRVKIFSPNVLSPKLSKFFDLWKSAKSEYRKFEFTSSTSSDPLKDFLGLCDKYILADISLKEAKDESLLLTSTSNDKKLYKLELKIWKMIEKDFKQEFYVVRHM